MLDGDGGVRELDTNYARLIPSMAARNRRHHVRDQVLFHILRQEFISNRDVTAPYAPEHEKDRIDADFNYGRYLSMCMGETLAEVVEVSIATWASMGLLASLFYLIMIVSGDNNHFLAWFMCASGWSVTLFNHLFHHRIMTIKDSYASAEILDHLCVDKGPLHKVSSSCRWKSGKEAAEERKEGRCFVSSPLCCLLFAYMFRLFSVLLDIFSLSLLCSFFPFPFLSFLFRLSFLLCPSPPPLLLLSHRSPFPLS